MTNNHIQQTKISKLRTLLSRIPLFARAYYCRGLATDAYAFDIEKSRKKNERQSFFAPIFHPKTAIKWFKILEHPDFMFITKYRDKLYFKPFRVYMSTKWNNNRKIKVIQDTYKYILDKGDYFKQTITNPDGIELASFALNEIATGYLRLGYDHRYRKEGELVLTFGSEEFGGTIAAASFSFEEMEPKQWVCRIACVQGHQVNDDNLSKKTQKLLFGIRPKSLLIIVLQEFVRQMGFVAIYGAGDSIQAYRKKHFIHLHWIHKINFDYDAIWHESSGVKCKDGWFELPLTPVRKIIKELKTSKRALYTRRYVFLDNLFLKLAETVQKIND